MKVFKKALIGLLIGVIVFSNIISLNSTMVVQAEGNYLPEPKIILAKTLSPTEVAPGDTVHIVVPIKTNQYIGDPYLSIDTKDAPLQITSEITLSKKGYSQPPTFIDGFSETNVEFDVKVKETAKAGSFNLYLKATGMNSLMEYKVDITMDRPIVIKVPLEKTKPSLLISDMSIPDEVKAGKEFSVKFMVLNKGELTAKDATVTVEGYATDGIMPMYTKTTTNLGDITQTGSGVVTLPLKVAATAVTGYKSLTIKMNCKDNEGNPYPVEFPIYVNILGSGTTVEGDPNILITDVTQSVSSPIAGSRVKVSFYLENKSSNAIKQIKVTPTNLTNANFSPVESKPYQYISYLKAGAKKKVTMDLTVSDKVTEGLNELDINYTYKDTNEKAYGPIAAKLFVLNVLNPEDEGSTPKLIISDFKASEENLKAGGTFDFNFDVLNTNSKVSARNIKVTLSSTDNVFSVTKGSNSFYIPVIKAGETVHNTKNLKIKADSITKAYPIEIKFEYEYDGMPKPADGTVVTGVSVSETINLQVMENARPVVSNIMFGYGEPPIVNTSTTLNFEFYNLGKSVLSNVTAKIESTDFTTTSTMLFIGNVDAGSGDVQELEITPMIEGQAKGTLIISYEDSNGNTIEVPTPFETTVNPMPTLDPGMEDPGMYPEVPLAKKAIVSTPIFIIILIVMFLIAIPIGRKITLGLYKKKLHKKEENMV